MNRQKLSLLALAGVVVLVAGAAAEQAPQPAPEAQASQPAPAARPKLVAPVRGVAQLGYTKPVVKNATIGGKSFVVTTIQVKNMANGAIAGLKVDEFWYDKAGNPVTGDNYRHRTPLQPGESHHDHPRNSKGAGHGPEPVQLHARQRRDQDLPAAEAVGGFGEPGPVHQARLGLHRTRTSKSRPVVSPVSSARERPSTRIT